MGQYDNQSRTMEVDNYQQSIQNEVDAVMLEAERKKRRQQLDKQINTLAERALAFEDQYGTEDYRTEIMTIFLDVTLEMKSVIDLLNDVGVALQCIGQAITCVDDVLNMQQEFLEVSLTQKYGFFERMRRRRKLNRAMRNNMGRMQQVVDMLVGSQKMALAMVAGLRKSCNQMKAFSQKNMARQNKRQAKMRNSNSGETQPSLAQKLLTEMRAKQGKTDDNAGAGAGNGGAGAGGSAPNTNAGAGGSSTDDISDIL